MLSPCMMNWRAFGADRTNYSFEDKYYQEQLPPVKKPRFYAPPIFDTPTSVSLETWRTALRHYCLDGTSPEMAVRMANKNRDAYTSARLTLKHADPVLQEYRKLKEADPDYLRLLDRLCAEGLSADERAALRAEFNDLVDDLTQIQGIAIDNCDLPVIKPPPESPEALLPDDVDVLPPDDLAIEASAF